MKHRAKLEANDRIATGYYFQVGDKHFITLPDAELSDFDLTLTGFVEIDPDTLRPVYTFGAAIAAKRKSLGLSQEKLAQIAGVSRNYVSQVERDEAQNLSAKVLFALGDALGIENEELIKMWRGSNA